MITTTSAAFQYAVAWLTFMPWVLEAGIQPFDLGSLVLPPSEAFVQYNDGYIRAPGIIDLTGLMFTAISESLPDTTDDTTFEEGDDEVLTDDDDDDGGERRRGLEEGVELEGTDIDIAVFHLPRTCVHSRKGCDWTQLGVGNRSDDGSLRWCCSQEAINLGICDEKETGYGRLILDPNKYKGEHRSVSVPPAGPMSPKSIRNGHFELSESGSYVVLYANCNENGREVYVTGESVWKSAHGYLPGELYGFMFFYTIITVVYFVLLIWYGHGMYVHKESRIEIEKWVFFAICLGLLEMIFRTSDYFVWNANGLRSNFFIWIGVLTGVLKQTISRCLLVMVSLGWGVVRDSLGSRMQTIISLGVAYTGIMAVRDMMIVFAIEDMNTLSYTAEEDIFSVVKILSWVVFLIDVVFIMWILESLNKTMVYLENLKQSRKLERFLKLRRLFWASVLFAVMLSVFSFVNTVREVGIVQEEQAWAIDAGTEVNYLFVLIGVAVLWRPHPSARDYAYAMELADGENEFELPGAVPFTMEDDDDEDNNPSAGDDADDHSRFQMT